MAISSQILHENTTIGTLLWCLFPLLLWGCSLPAPNEPELDRGAPPLQTEKTKIESIEEGELRWTATLEKAWGNFDDLNAEGIYWVSKSQQDEGKRVEVRSPRGRFLLQDGTAQFTNPTLTTEQGIQIRSSTANYQEKTQRVQTDGPVKLSGPEWNVTGHDLSVDLSEKSMKLQGPVKGRWDPKNALHQIAPK